MSKRTRKRIEELRMIAESAKDSGNWQIECFDFETDTVTIRVSKPRRLAMDMVGKVFGTENATHIVTFDPQSVLGLLDEFEQMVSDLRTENAAVIVERDEARMLCCRAESEVSGIDWSPGYGIQHPVFRLFGCDSKEDVAKKRGWEGLFEGDRDVFGGS